MFLFYIEDGILDSVIHMSGRTFCIKDNYRLERFCSRLIDVDLDLYYCGIENCIETFTCGSHALHNFLIHYIVKGRGYYLCNNKRYELSQGDAFAIFPGDIIYYATYPDDPWSFCWFAFNGKKAVEYLKNCGITKSTPVKAILPEFALDDLVQRCVYAFPENGDPNKTQLQGYLYLIFSKMQESHLKTEHAVKENKYAEHVRKALIFIEYNYYKPLTVQSICNYVSLERTYFSKIFSRCTGMSPQDYLIHYRIEKAVQLMKTSTLSLKQIGMSVGIPNEYYFSKLFKQLKGVSPKKYRISPVDKV